MTVTRRQEPGPGTLAYGEKVLVEEGTCPPGQIKQVTGENEAQTIPRKIACVEDKR